MKQKRNNAKTERLKNLRVRKKFQKVFKNIVLMLIVAVIVAFAGIGMMSANASRFYNESYVNMQRQLEITRDIQSIDKYVLWSLTVTGSEQEEKLTGTENYIKQVEENIQTLETTFSDTDLTAQLDAAWQEMREEIENINLILAASSSSGSAEAFDRYNAEYAQVSGKVQDVLAEVGEAADAQAETAYGRINSLTTIVIVGMLIVGALCFAFCLKSEKNLTALLTLPIHELQEAAKKLNVGRLDIQIEYTSEDELGDLAQNFREACAQMQLVIQDVGVLLSRMAGGCFNADTEHEEYYVGDFRLLLDSIRKMEDELNRTLGQINQASGQVMAGSGQLADSAQSMSGGASEQADAVEELIGTIGNVANLAKDSAEGSAKAAASAKASAENAGKSREEINVLLDAMERINTTSKEIENIIGTIEDIASQTNLLSLNASIEAARAGEVGKGFAVVADQIGKLAAGSAQSAVDTRELINKSLEEIENGNRIVENTMETIGDILASMEEFSDMASGMAETSETQAGLLRQIEDRIGQISTVVDNNSAAAEETSAISEELSSQAQSLEQMVAAFELKK